MSPLARRSLLVDFITVYGLGGKAIVFTETKREADEVAAALANTHPCEVRFALLRRQFTWHRASVGPDTCSLWDATSMGEVGRYKQMPTLGVAEPHDVKY